MARITFSYAENEVDSSPHRLPVTVIGLHHDLSLLPFSLICPKFGPYVTNEMWLEALTRSGTVNLYMNLASVCFLPSACSRYNCKIQPSAMSRFVRQTFSGESCHLYFILCETHEALAVASAVARAFPLFNAKSNKAAPSKIYVQIYLTDLKTEQPPPQGLLDALQETCLSVRLTSEIADSPASEINVDSFVKMLVDLGNEFGITPKIVSGEDLLKQGFGGHYHVGKAALQKPAFVVLSHVVGDDSPNIALVGKGIVYDTGGLALKPKTSMPGMKRDCTGAATVFGIFRAAMKLGFRKNLHALFCLAENAIGPNAVRPDDIITLYSGRTVEVNNPDAEGRLVLGDAVAYAHRKLDADFIIDIATLTGSAATTTGRLHACLLSNNEIWERNTVAAGKVSGDLVHPLIFAPEIFSNEFSSSVADMRNSIMDRTNAPTTCAGSFIFNHIDADFNGVWIHLDIAAASHNQDRATGHSVGLLLTLFGHDSKNDYLNFLAQRLTAA